MTIHTPYYYYYYWYNVRSPFHSAAHRMYFFSSLVYALLFMFCAHTQAHIVMRWAMHAKCDKPCVVECLMMYIHTNLLRVYMPLVLVVGKLCTLNTNKTHLQSALNALSFLPWARGWTVVYILCANSPHRRLCTPPKCSAKAFIRNVEHNGCSSVVIFNSENQSLCRSRMKQFSLKCIQSTKRIDDFKISLSRKLPRCFDRYPVKVFTCGKCSILMRNSPEIILQTM